MSKNFEQAYKELTQAEAPDLWDRIEAGLKSKSTPEKERVKIKPDMKEKKTFVLRRYSGVIAAAVCVAVILPAVVLIRQSSKGYSFSDMSGATAEGIDDSADSGAGYDTAAWPADTESMTGGVLHGNETAQVTESAAEDGIMEEATADAVIDMADRIEQDKKAEAADAAIRAMKEESQTLQDAEEKKMSDSNDRIINAEAETAQSDSQASGIADGTIFEHVVIEVTKAGEEFYEDGEELPGILYVGIVRQNLSGLEAGEQIVVYAPTHFSAALFADGVFEVDLEYKRGREYTYILQGYHQQIK